MEGGNLIGKMIMLLVGVILITILIPIVADSANYMPGSAANNQVKADVYSAASTVTHTGVTSQNVTRWSNGWLNASGNDVTQATPTILNTATAWTVVSTVRFDSSTDPSKNYTLWSKAADGTNPEMLLYHEGDSGLLYFALQSNETVMGENCSYNTGISINGTGNIDNFITVGVLADAANITFYENTTAMTVGDILRCTNNVTQGAFVVGKYSGAVNYGAFTGGIGDFQAYNKSLTNFDIVGVGQDYENDSLKVHMMFNDNIGAIAYDTVHQNNGVITGTTVWDNTGVYKTLSTAEYTISSDDTSYTMTLASSFWKYNYLMWTYDYDERTSMGGGVSTVIALIEIVLAIALLAFAYWTFKDNIEELL